MTTIYDRGRALAIRQLRLIAQGGKGAPARITQYGPQVYANGVNTQSETQHDGSGVRTQYALRDIDGVHIQVGDFRLLLSPIKVDGTDMPEPQVAWGVQFAGERYKVMSVKPWNYDGTPCGFAVQVRK